MFILPKTTLRAERHPDATEIKKELDTYFLSEWPFPCKNAGMKFLQANVSMVACLVFPNGPKYRVKLAGEVRILFTLIDDVLEKSSFLDSAALVEKLISIGHGCIASNPADSVENIHHDMWQRLRMEDPVLGLTVCEAHYDLLRAQCNPQRSEFVSLKEYLDFREVEIGSKLYISISYFIQRINPTAAQRAALTEIERKASNHFVIINDIISWDRELKESLSGTEESKICSSVVIVAEQFGVDYEDEKNILATALRATEKVFMRQRDKLLVRCASSEELEMNDDVKKLVGDLQLRLAGGEQWHFETGRYQV